jgi:hypothetical protein
MSLSKATDEINVTPVAISHQIAPSSNVAPTDPLRSCITTQTTANAASMSCAGPRMQ